MKILNRVSLYFKGRGLLDYAAEKLLSFETTTFNDGSLKIRIPDIAKHSMEKDFIINCHAQNLDDIMVVSQLVDIIRANTRVIPNIQLVLSSPLYMRYDRIMHEDRTDSFGLQRFVKFVKATGVNTVTLIDPHSDVAKQLFESHFGADNVFVVHQNSCLASMLFKTPLALQADKDSFMSLENFAPHYGFILPDEGALKKQGGPASSSIALVMRKTRDPETGKISGVEPFLDERFIKDRMGNLNRYYNPDVSGNKRLMIVDDICEKGGTFIGVVKKLRSLGLTVPIDLYVTHGVFPCYQAMGAMDGVFDNIYIYSTRLHTYNNLKAHMTLTKIHTAVTYTG